MTGDVKLRFGKAIKEQRSALQISQEELADRAGLHRTYVSDVERGARNPSLESIGKLAHALDVSIAMLFTRAFSNVSAAKSPVEILLVEDNRRDAELTQRAFRKARIANPLQIVNDGEAALDFVFARGRYSQRRGKPMPGVVLLDLNLPGISGIEVLQRIKANPRTQHIPVIVLTVSRADADIRECRRLGAESYLIKPVGFRNFSDVTPELHLEWALVKSSNGSRDKNGEA